MQRIHYEGTDDGKASLARQLAMEKRVQRAHLFFKVIHFMIVAFFPLMLAYCVLYDMHETVFGSARMLQHREAAIFLDSVLIATVQISITIIPFLLASHLPSHRAPLVL